MPQYFGHIPFVALLLALNGCAQLEAKPELPAESARPISDETRLDRLVGDAEAAHPGKSAFRLVSDGREAFVLRWFSAERAERSIDVQTYIWHADTTGLALASRLLSAADRGVRVRLLVDDMDARSKNVGFAALQAHPNIDVRMFNPFATRWGTVRFVGEAARSFKRINRRMHNKSWLVDNRIALVGGRNLGDEYFGASESVNMEDLEFVMAGPVVRDISASFDHFWNSPVAYPIELLDAGSVTDENLQALRERLAKADAEAKSGWYAEGLRSGDPMQRLLHGDWPVQWSGEYTFVSDDPLKATGTLDDADASNVGKLLFPAMWATESKLTIISPYFVPGDQGAAALVDIAREPKKVLILTNSLASNDVAAVHGGYSKERKTLLEGGVELWEIKPTGGTQVASTFKGSSGAGLHTKALTIDGKRLFVGSYNLDPRSTALNSEQGVMVEDAVLAEQLEAIFAIQTSDANAWRVTLQDGKLSWTDGTDTYDSDPKASMWRRFQAWFARAFGLESQ
ncbi:MAG: phospholipase D family protein, partial [Woeseiaceae bacterium]